MPVIYAILAILIMLPTLRHGWLMDDTGFRARFIGDLTLDESLLKGGTPYGDVSTVSKAMANLYSFFGSEKAVRAMMDYGAIPWWTYPKVKISFWRPLTALTIWLDYRLFPHSGPLQHLHSILWFAGAVFLLTLLYRQLMPVALAASLGALLYTIDECYYTPVAFLANRNALIALVFGLCAILLHDQWRKKNSVVAVFMAGLSLALSLLSAEAGIATMAYLIAYALVLDNAKWPGRLLSLVPYFIVIGVWRLVYRAMGYGTFGSGLYTDPASEPMRFIELAMERGPILLSTQLLGLPAEIFYGLSPGAQIIVLLTIVLLLALMVPAMRPLLSQNKQSRFWLIGMLLAVVPICATLAAGRNLLFVGIGAMGLVGSFMCHMLNRNRIRAKRKIWRIAGWILFGLFVLNHLVGAGLSRFALPKIYDQSMAILENPSKINNLPIADKQCLVVVNTPCPLMMMGIPILNTLEGTAPPQSIRCLAPAFETLELERIDQHNIVVRARQGGLLFTDKTAPHPGQAHHVYFLEQFNTILRDSRRYCTVRDRVILPGMSVEIRQLDKHKMPKEVLFTFDVPLEDPTLKWVRWDWDQECYVDFTVPQIGRTAVIARGF